MEAGIELPVKEGAGEQAWGSAEYYLKSFHALAESRQVTATMASIIVQPLMYSEIRTYWYDHAPDNQDIEDLDDFAYLVRECDKVWLEHANAKAPEKKK